jgi:hypothetical protein
MVLPVITVDLESPELKKHVRGIRSEETRNTLYETRLKAPVDGDNGLKTQGRGATLQE